MAFKIPQIPSSVLAVLGLYSWSFVILNAVESSIALSNYYIMQYFKHKNTNLITCNNQFQTSKSIKIDVNGVNKGVIV